MPEKKFLKKKRLFFFYFLNFSFLSFMFPDTADAGLFGSQLGGPAQIAVTEAVVPLPDDLSADQLAAAFRPPPVYFCPCRCLPPATS